MNNKIKIVKSVARNIFGSRYTIFLSGITYDKLNDTVHADFRHTTTLSFPAKINSFINALSAKGFKVFTGNGYITIN